MNANTALTPLFPVVTEHDEPRRVPFDIDIEQALLGAFIVDNSAIARALQLLRPEHLYDPLHQRMFGAMVASFERGDNITPLTLHARLKADPGLIEAGGIVYLTVLAEAAPARPDVSDYALVSNYARILRSLAMRRKMVGVFDDAITRACDAPGERSAVAAIEEAEQALQDIRDAEPDCFDDPLPVIDLARWACEPVPERLWHVQDRIPAASVTLFSGKGDAGKTMLALQASVATVLAREWLGIIPRQGRVLVICCEDDERELHIRVAKIAEYYGVRFEDLINGLFLTSLVGRETVLALPDRTTGTIRPTPLFQHLARLATKIKPALIVIDNTADVYGGNENDRAQVRQFIALLRRLAVLTGAAVVLTSHPSVRGEDTQTGISGSTAWHASVRARLYLHNPKKEGETGFDPDHRILEVKKSNYGPAGEKIRLRWQNGLFVPTGPLSWIDKRAAENAAGEAFLRLLARYQQQHRNVSHIPASPNYGPRLFAGDPEADGFDEDAFKGAMNRLFAADRIHIEEYGKPSRLSARIVVGPEPRGEQQRQPLASQPDVQHPGATPV